MEAIKEVRSAIRPTHNACLYLLMPTDPKYTVSTKNVVSELPCIVDANLPINESGPKVLINSVAKPKAQPPERGRIIASGSTSPGIPKIEITGLIALTTIFIAPEFLKIPIATSIATK